MARSTTTFVCQSCGAVHPKWGGRCESCGAWNTLVEEEAVSAAPGGLAAPKTLSRKAGKVELTSLSATSEAPERHTIGVEELDRVFGGGLVPSSATLIGGDPGIGKSTLLLQVAARLARNGLKTISWERQM